MYVRGSTHLICISRKKGQFTHWRSDVQSAVRVAVNGYGVIGKRIADAVAVQADMELVGIADVVSDWRIKVAVGKGHPVFASTPDAANTMRDAGIPVVGLLGELLGRVDVIADATPKKIASTNLITYRATGVKSIFQGGEKHSLTGHSFVTPVC